MKNAVSIQMKNEEEHIVSVIVHVRPENLPAVILAMDALEGVERVANDGLGKEVVLISAPTAKRVMERIEDIQDFDGVLNTAMVAHHAETTDVLDEEIELSQLVMQQSGPTKSNDSMPTQES
jgi:nitrate reductase NapD